HREHPGAQHRGLETGQVKFAQRAFVETRVHAVAIELLVVARKVFHTRGDAFGLDAFDRGNNQLRDQKRIFAVVLKIASAQRRAHEVDARAEDDVFTAFTRLRAEHLAVQAGELRIPRRRQRAAGGQVGAGVVEA